MKGKRLFAILLCALMIASLLPGGVFAGDNTAAPAATIDQEVTGEPEADPGEELATLNLNSSGEVVASGGIEEDDQEGPVPASTEEMDVPDEVDPSLTPQEQEDSQVIEEAGSDQTSADKKAAGTEGGKAKGAGDKAASVKDSETHTIEYWDATEYMGKPSPPDGDYITGHWPETATAAPGEVVSLPPIIPGPYPTEKLYGDGWEVYTWEWYNVYPKGSNNTGADDLLDESTGTFVMPDCDVIVAGAWVFNDSIQFFTYATEGGKVHHDGHNASWAEFSYATLTAEPNPGYYFVGWCEGDLDGPTGQVFSTQNPLRIHVTSDNRYHRYWAVFAERSPGHITVNGGFADQTTAKEGATVSIIATEPTGYQVFDKWVADPATVQFGDASASQTTFTMPPSDVTITATYAELHPIHVLSYPADFIENYVSGGGAYRKGETVTLTASDVRGYRFSGWWGFVDGPITDFKRLTTANTYTFTVDHETTFEARYIELASITIEQSEGGTATASQEFSEYPGETITITATTTHASYDFDHWEVISGDVELADANSAETTFVTNGNDVVIKPHFERKQVIIILPDYYTVTYNNLNGATNPNPATYTTEDTPITLAALQDTAEYTFDGWYDNPDCTGAAITEIPEGYAGNMVFYAKWTPIPDVTPDSYTVTYNNLKGATNPNPATYTREDTPITLAALQDTAEYTFDGWYDNPDCTGAAITEIPEGSTGNKVFYAKWSPIPYDIAVDGGTADKTTATAGETVTITADEPQDGYAFVQWYSDDDVDFAQQDNCKTTFTMPASNVSVQATVMPILLEALPDQVYTGKAIEPALAPSGIALGGADLAIGSDQYDISYTDNVDVGPAKVTVTFKGNRVGHKTVTFRILPADISTAAVNTADQKYDGTALTPKPKVIWNGMVLAEGKDYTLSYDNNVKEGTATVLVKGMGNFEGTATGTFDILSASGAKKGTLTFDLGGGTLDGRTGTITIEAEVGDVINLPGAPTREGYAFQYWKGSKYEAGAKYKVEGNHTFTAVWKKTGSTATGDTSNLTAWFSLALASAVMMLLCAAYRRREER